MLADAYNVSIVEGEKARIQQNANVITQKALGTAQADYALALDSGNQKLIEQTQATLAHAENQRDDALQVEKNNAAARDSLALAQQTAQAQDITLPTLRERASLIGQTSDEAARQLAIFQAELKVQTKFADTSDAVKQHHIEIATKLADENYLLQEQLRAQGRIDQMLRSIAGTLDNTIGWALNEIFSGKKITDWGQRFQNMLATISTEILQTEILRPTLGSPIAGAVSQQYGVVR
jgi:hypothetical protein